MFRIENFLSSREYQMSDEISFIDLRGDSLNENIKAASTLSEMIIHNSFGPDKRTSQARMTERLNKEGNIIFAISSGLLPLGFISYGITNPLIQGERKKIIHYTRAVNKAFQGQGIARKLLSKVLDLEKPAIVSAKSQNPTEILSFLIHSTKYGWETFPFQKTYDSTSMSMEILEHLTSSLDIQDYDWITGLCRNVYKEGKLGDYVIRTEDPRIDLINKRLIEVGLDRNNGDSLMYVGIRKS